MSHPNGWNVYRRELAEAIREAVDAGEDGVTLGPSDALTAAEALEARADEDGAGNVVELRPTEPAD